MQWILYKEISLRRATQDILMASNSWRLMFCVFSAFTLCALCVQERGGREGAKKGLFDCRLPVWNRFLLFPRSHLTPPFFPSHLILAPFVYRPHQKIPFAVSIITSPPLHPNSFLKGFHRPPCISSVTSSLKLRRGQWAHISYWFLVPIPEICQGLRYDWVFFVFVPLFSALGRLR